MDDDESCLYQGLAMIDGFGPPLITRSVIMKSTVVGSLGGLEGLISWLSPKPATPRDMARFGHNRKNESSGWLLTSVGPPTVDKLGT
jgi:hypothetical protein